MRRNPSGARGSRLAWIFSLLTSVALLLPVSVGAHAGGLDGYGCHHNRKLGGYHCHRGPFAGQSFASQAEMLERLKAGEDETKSGTSKSPAERLEALKALREKGLITEEEYQAKRKAILEGL